MKIAVLVLATLLAIASFAPLIRKDDWWIRIFDFPRLQILGMSLLVLLAFFFYWDLRTWYGIAVLAVLVLAILVQGFRIIPYTPIYPKQVKLATRADPDSTIALVVANVLMSNRDANSLLRSVRERDPDIVLVLEPDDWWAEQLSVLEEKYPYTIKEPLDNRYGMLLYSRLELVDPEIKHLISDEFPSMHMQIRLRSGDLVWLHCLHPEPPSPTEADESSRRDAELLIVGKEVKERAMPTIVAGDMNDVAWSYTTTLFQKISGLLDPRRGRGMFNSYHAQYPIMRWPLDHVFHSEHFFLGEIARLPAFGSDHFPVYTRLVFQPGAAARQEGIKADQEEKEQAVRRLTKWIKKKDSRHRVVTCPSQQLAPTVHS